MNIFKKIMLVLLLGACAAPSLHAVVAASVVPSEVSADAPISKREIVAKKHFSIGMEDTDTTDPRNGSGFMVDSWKGGFTRRFLRALMYAVRDQIVAFRRSCDALDSAIARLCSQKNRRLVKVARSKNDVKKEIVAGSARVDALRERMDSAPLDYQAPGKFNAVRRKAFPHALADMTWDAVWFSYSIGGMWLISAIRRNFRRSEKMRASFDVWFKKLAIEEQRAVELHLELYNLMRCVSPDNQVIVKALLDDALVNKNNRLAMNEAQANLLGEYHDGDKATAVPIMEIARDIVAQQASYVQKLNRACARMQNMQFVNSLAPVAAY